MDSIDASCDEKLLSELRAGGVAQDHQSLLTEIRKLREENQQLREHLTAALDGTGICLWQGLVQTGELTVFNLQNFKPGDMVPRFEQWKAKLHPNDRTQALDCYFGHLEGRYAHYEAEYRTLTSEGHVTWLWDRGRIIEWDEHGQPYRIIGAHIDITQRKEYERRLARQADTDPLTGLFNRQAFTRMVRMAMGDTHDGAMLFIDLDDFKLVNDALGHACGDRVLLQVADWLQRLLPDGGLCSRYGGDEFVVFVPPLDGVSAEAAGMQLAQQLLSLSDGYVLMSGSLRISMSIGILLWTKPPTFEQAIEMADSAMYQAKQTGKRGIRIIQIAE